MTLLTVWWVNIIKALQMCVKSIQIRAVKLLSLRFDCYVPRHTACIDLYHSSISVIESEHL